MCEYPYDYPCVQRSTCKLDNSFCALGTQMAGTTPEHTTATCALHLNTQASLCIFSKLPAD
jgi:hypothetical protein